MTASIKTIIDSLTPDTKAALEAHARQPRTTYTEGYLRGAYANGGILTDHFDRLIELIRDRDGYRIIAACFTKPELEITDGERSLYRWQYKALGGFERSLWDAILAADSTNLDAIAKGFPEHVAAFRRYANEAGYWDALVKRIDQP